MDVTGHVAPSGREEGQPQSANRVVTALSSREVPFVGRRPQIEGLASVIRESGSAGPCPVAIITGEAGIGKSTLVEQLRQLVPGPTYLIGRCLDFGDAPSYSPFVSILRELFKEEELEHIRGELTPAVRAALSWLSPELAGDSPIVSGPRARLFDAVLSLLETVARETPTVLVVEDVHWADQSTWDLLLFIMANAADTRLTTLLTHRQLPAGHPLRGSVAELARLPQVSHYSLEGLGRADVAAQFAALSGAPPTRHETDEVMRLSSGNPLYVEAAVDLIRHNDEQAGYHRDLLLAPVERLPEAARGVVRILAVAGGDVLHRTLLIVSGLNDEQLEEAVRPAIEARVVVPTPDGYRFRHHLITTLVHDELLLPSERVRLHRVFAEQIEDDPSLAPQVVFHAAREIARHWKEAGEPRHALPATWEAAREGRDLLAHPERLRMLQDLLSLWSSVPDASTLLGVNRARILHDAVEAAEESGHSELGIDLAVEALSEALEADEGVIAAAVLERRSRLRAQLGVPGAADDLQMALEHLPPGPSDLRGQLLAQLADRLRWACDREAAVPLAHQSLEVALAAGDGYGRVRANLAIFGLMAKDDLETARSGIDAARSEAAGSGLPVLEALAAFAAAEVEILAGQRMAAATAARAGLRAAKDAGQEASLGARLAAQLTDSLVALGQWDEASEALEHALELDPPPGYRARLLATQGALNHARGDSDEARLTLQELAALKSGRARWGDADTELAAAVFTTTLALDAGQDEEAFRTALESIAVWGERELPFSAWPLLVIAAAASKRSQPTKGKDSANHNERDALRELAERAPVMGTEGRAWQATFLAELARSGTELAAVREEALAAWREAGQPWHIGWALVGSSYALLASSRKIEAAARLREALDIADALRAEPLSNAVNELAERAGIELSPAVNASPGAKSPHGLTPRELEVLGLISLGRTNRQIGEELFISAKTASIHVSRILAKMGVANRGEAAAAAHRLGLVTETLNGQ